MKKVIKHPKKMKNAMYIVFGVFALALFAITRIHPSYANEGLMIDEALDAIVLYGEVEQLPEDEEVEEIQDEEDDEDIVEPELTPEEKAEELDENSQDLENDEENLDGEEVDNRKNGENEDGDKEGKTEEIEGTSETEEGDNEPEVQIPEVSSDEENHGVDDNEPSEEAISEKNEQFSILTENFVLKTADVGNTITITYNTNLGKFEGGENTKDVVYTYTEPTEGTKYSHTPNISDAGVQSGNYATGLAINQTIRISGSQKLHISLKYATETNYDYIYVFKGTYTGTPTKNMKEGQLYTFNGDSSNTLKTSDFYVDGDEVTFSFYSDSSSNYYGYYATIEGIGGYVTDETVEKPVREGYSFMGWYETGAENPYDFSQKVTENKILYAKRDVAKTITYNANGGSFKSGTNSMITQDVIYTRQNDGTYIPDNNIQFPNKISDNMAAQSGWMFDGWYTSTTNQTASTEWTGYVNENTQSQTVYAKWLPFNDLKVDIGGTGFTIMDRNLGATSNDISSSNSYGKYYQWGNNYGFLTYDISLLNTSSIKVDETPYGPGNYYISATYITTDDGIRTQQQDWRDDLWGGYTDTDEAMQGPCPEGYHVASSDEMFAIYEAFQRGVYPSEGEDFCKDYDNYPECFSAKFHFPLAGYYDDYNKITNQNAGYYWTSYKKSWSSALALMMDSSDSEWGYPAINGVRMGGLLPVRCFKNEYEAPTPQSIEITYDPNGGAFSGKSVNETTVVTYTPGDTYTPDINIQFPNKAMEGETGYMFAGWYTSATNQVASTEWTGYVDENTQSQTVYAKYLPFNEKSLTMSGITFTIMDRNMGAEAVSDGAYNNKTANQLGYYYQWGNNYGFKNSGSVPHSVTTQIDITGKGYGPGNYYSSATFVKRTSSPYRWDTDTSSTTYTSYGNLNLWGGENTSNPDSWRQGPCPENYHVPDTLEWKAAYNLFKSWADTVGSGYCNTFDDTSTAKPKCFAAKLGLPFAGSRDYNVPNVDLQGTYGYYWSSSPYPSSAKSSYYLLFNSTGLNPHYDSYRANGFSVRCFKNSSTKALTFSRNGEIIDTKNVRRWEPITTSYKPANPSGTTENWYTDSELTSQFTFGNTTYVKEAKTLYSKITCNNSSYIWNGTECVQQFTVTLNATTNGGTITPTSVTVANGAQFPLENYIASKDGYTFEGWAETSGTTGVLTSNPTITANKTLYAVFSKTLTGTFNKDSSVSSITTNSATCTLWNNESSCTLTAPTINCANGYSNGVWSPLSMTISENTTFTASCNDVQKPVCNISTQPIRTLMSLVNGYNQGTVTFTCTDNVGVSTNNLSASNITYDSNVVTLSNFIVGGTSTSKTFTFTYTAKVAGNTSFTLKAGVVSDVAGNSNLVTSASNSVTVDTTAPVLSTKTSFENIWYTANQTSTFTYTDTGAGITAGENTASCTISTEGIASTCQITPNICDKVGNCNTTFQTSNSIKLDKTAPVFTGKTQFTTGWYNTDQTSIFIYEDTVSGISGANTTSCVINEEGTAAKCTVENTNICNNAGLCNTINQTSNSIKLDKTNPTCSITGNPTSPINQDVELTLNYLVESNQISTGYSWDGEVYTSTQKFTVTQNGTYTGYVRDAAGNTGSCSVVVDKIDKNLPVITINNPDTTTAQSKTITATKNKGTLYMSITGANVCDSTLEFVAYAEITFNLESDNGKYVCYKVEDDAGNVVYKISNQIAGIKELSRSSGGGGTKKSETDTKEIAIETSDEQHNSADNGQEIETPEMSNTSLNEETSNQVISVSQEISEDGTPVEVVIQTVTIKNTDIVATVRTETPSSNTAKSSSSRFTKEENDAYSFAKSNGITTTDSIDNAKMNTELTRIQMAKMLSNFAINVLGEEPDVSKGIVKFDDVTNKMDNQYDNAVTKAYQLGIMGQNMKNNEFRPNDEVTRAEFASALSRLLYKTDEGKYRSTGKYYIPHVAKLYNEGIINKTDPKIKEKRGYVMLMLMRTVQ